MKEICHSNEYISICLMSKLLETFKKRSQMIKMLLQGCAYMYDVGHFHAAKSSQKPISFVIFLSYVLCASFLNISVAFFYAPCKISHTDLGYLCCYRSSHILPCRPSGVTLDIKKSSYKKLSKWLQSKSTTGLVSFLLLLLLQRNFD